METFRLIWSGENNGAVNVDSWPNPAPALKTVAMFTNNFEGEIIIQATIEANPTEGDWFDIHSEVFEFPNRMVESTVDNRFFNTRDRYVWMRAKTVETRGRIDKVVIR